MTFPLVLLYQASGMSEVAGPPLLRAALANGRHGSHRLAAHWRLGRDKRLECRWYRPPD